MLRTLNILCILLKVLMVTSTIIALSSKEEDRIAHQIIPSFKIINVRDYMSSNIEFVQNYSDSVTMKNEVALQEGITSSPGFLSEPTFPRAFVEFGNRLNKTDICVTFRWNKPEFTNEVIQKYRVQYWFIENLKKIQTSVDIILANNKILQHKVFNLKFDTIYYFKVQAHNKFGGGPYTKFINVSTTHENPIPLLLIKSFNYIGVYDMDLQIRFALIKFIIDNYTEIVYSALEHQIYGINEKEELITCDFNLSTIETQRNCTRIIDLSSDNPVCNLQIDWVARNLYWKQRSNDDKKSYIMKLDLTLWQQMGIAKYDKILQIDKFSLFLVLPSTGFLYWSEFISDERIIMQSDFDGKNIKPFLKNKDNNCFCPYKPLEYSTYMQIDNTNIDKPLIYWTSKDRLFATDIYNCKCNLISVGNETNFDYITIDKTNIYLYSEQKKIFYMLKKKDDFLKSKENAVESVTKVCIQNSCSFFVYRSIALDKSLQSYPPTICLTPNMKDYHVEEVTTNANSVVVSLPEPIPNDGCKKHNLATTIYTISVNYLTCLDNNFNKSEEFNVQTYKRHYEIQNLIPFTEYTLKLALSNFYFDKLSMGLQFGADVKLTTTGKLNAPEDVTVQVLTPTLAAVYWMPPKKLNCVTMNYEVHWMQLSNGTQEIQKSYRSTNPIDKPERTLDGKFFTIIRSLLPKQKYKIYVSVYPTIRRNFINDSLPKIVYMEPNNLILSGISTNGMNISWIPSTNLTNHIGLHYILEYKNDAVREWQIANNTEKNNDKVTYYIENLLPQTLYKFHLILKYPEHTEDYIWPPDGKEFTFQTLGNVPSAPGIPLILSIVVTLVLICVCYFYYSYRQLQASKEIVHPSIIINIESPLYKTSSGNVQLNDAKSKYNLDEFALTMIEKKKIILREFLGSGAFGKVFQGIIKDFEGSDTTPVAIKMLRENATSTEKMEFLEEAKLMSDFRHKHVLKLLGICIDMDSPWLILELMEAGDLLKYLRENRTLRPSDSQALRLQDLLAMCEDVARGCCYLEEQHFVHRDLACRNCLISGRNRKNRIVKIGDFGLARDIYKEDYYRMEGETPLPIRWMAPESLKYRKFTSKSDVWAFGVLMWEIMSLGQQPYYARNDIEVCIYVREGGKLSKPLNCPSALYQLMLSCWNAMKERPKFKLCLENIVTLRDNIEDAMLNSMDIIKRVQLPPSEIPEYLQMEDLVESTANHISERLTGNDTSNDVIEPLI